MSLDLFLFLRTWKLSYFKNNSIITNGNKNHKIITSRKKLMKTKGTADICLSTAVVKPLLWKTLLTLAFVYRQLLSGENRNKTTYAGLLFYQQRREWPQWLFKIDICSNYLSFQWLWNIYDITSAHIWASQVAQC